MRRTHRPQFGASQEADFSGAMAPSGPEEPCGRELPLRADPSSLRGDGVIPPAAQRIAPGDAGRAQQQPFQAAMGLDGLQRVLAARRRKAAAAPKAGADEALVKSDGRAERVPASLRKAHSCGAGF